MALEMSMAIIAATTFAFVGRRCNAFDHTVGDLLWSIPPTKKFYTNWSTNHFFQVGDTLVFTFETNFHNVMQVSKRQFESCSGEDPVQAFWTGPVTISLQERGVYYFICSLGNYCSLGQKLSVIVHSTNPTPPSSNSPSPSSSPKLPPTQVSPAAVPLSSPQLRQVPPSPSVAVDSSRNDPVNVHPSKSSGVGENFLSFGDFGFRCFLPLIALVMMSHQGGGA